jgi:hypothetical protein
VSAFTDEDGDPARTLRQRAYALFDAGDLRAADDAFSSVIELQPDDLALHYMRGLACKYLRDWPASLQHNLRVQALETEFDPASAWNAAIAATGSGDWAQARHQWARCGIELPVGDGPIDADFGIACVRLNPWAEGETVFIRRIDPVRGRLLNVPLPESGHRFGDVVLHDGASTGTRWSGESDVPVFNVLQLLQPSDYRTFAVFIQCPDADALEQLQQAILPGIGYVEDWTLSIRHLCLRCSYGAPHTHERDDTGLDEAGNDDWHPERSLGIAAQGRAAVTRLLAAWAAAAPGRSVDSITHREHERPAPAQDRVWWRGTDEGDAPGT